MPAKYANDLMLAQLIPEEGERYFVYDDANGQAIRAGSHVIGNPTIGIGRELASNGLSDAEARFLCVNDILKVSIAFDAAIPWWNNLSPLRQMQLTDLAFNMGIHELLNCWPNFLTAMQAGNWEKAVLELKTSRWWQEVGTRGPLIAERILSG